MNTEATLENTTPATPGERLRQARERMGLTQQTVAERLCLKLSTVREIEDGNTPPDLAPTFLRGYIRSYAKLVHIPESELLPVLDKHVVPRVANVAPMRGFALGKSRKKRDGWLMTFTWLVLLVVLGLTGAWWWQNYQAQQQEINSMVDHATSSEQDDGQPGAPQGSSNAQSIDLTQIAPTSPVDIPSNSAAAAAPANGTALPLPVPQTPATNTVTAAPVTDPAHSPTSSPVPTPDAASAAAVPANTIVMTFTADCWLEVIDAAGKKLFSGVQRNGGALNLSGQAPYRLKIGAPAAVQIQYQGQPVDLSRFVRSNQIARLTLAAE